jgi:hypothetical protein
MVKLRFSDALEELALAAGVCATVNGGGTNPAVLQLTNEAGRRLARRGHALGTVQRYRINVTSSQITWPRQVTTIEAVAFCDQPGVVRNEWFEFLGQGPGLLDCNSCLWHTLVDRDPACCFNDITPGKKDRQLRVYADVQEAADAYITLEGYDENGNWIRTKDAAGAWQNGEKVLISSAAPTLSQKKFTFLTAVSKPATNGNVRVYEYDSATLANVQVIGFYEPDETNPIYRRSLLPGVMQGSSCNDCDQRQVTVAVKLTYIPVRNDSDWLMIANIDALKLAIQAILKERKNLIAEASNYFSQAKSELDWELREFKGDGAVVVPRVAPYFGGGNIPLIT